MRYCFLLILGWLLSACSLLGPMPEQQHIPVAASVPEKPMQVQSKGWWNVHFSIAWPEGVEADWSVDVFLAHKIIRPVLTQYRKDIALWRFHRRAARDLAGHQFSFMFYSTAAVAEEIYQAIRQEKSLQVVLDEGVIRRVIYQDTSVNHSPEVKDTSDKSWSLPIQRSWPYYIMGVSDMWLRLIDELVQQNTKETDINNGDDEMTYYQTISTKLDDTWRNEGGHAFLHHLNALFGYQDTMILERRYVHF